MADLEIGSTLAGYRVDALIARGGMGVVYRATQLALDRPVALKVIARDLADREGFRERFLRESRLAASLEHPAVVPVYDSRQDQGELIVAMRLIRGGDLKRMIEREGPLPPERAVALLSQVAEALDAAHEQGIVHRDVKPHNILVEPPDRAYLTDFGLAKAIEESGARDGGSIVGTVEYMAPEQWRGEPVGPAADVYALGCVLFETLTGVVPYARRGDERQPQLPRGLDRVIERAVSQHPRDRYAGAGELIAAAREHETGTPAPTLILSDPGDRPTAEATQRLPGAGDRGAATRGRLRPLRGLTRLIAGLAAAAGVAVLVALVLLIGGGGGVSVSAPIPVGRTPLRLAAGEGAVWVTSGLDGTLTRIDPQTMRPEGEPLRVGRGVSAVAVGEGSVWVSVPRRGQVLRVDPEINRVTERIDVGGRPGPIAVGHGQVWVVDASGGGISVIDPGEESVAKRGIRAGPVPLRIAAGARTVWVSSAPTAVVREIDPRTERPGPPIRVGRGPAGIAVGGGYVWVANSRSGTVSRIDPADGRVVGDPIEVGERPGGIDTGSDLAWVANAGDGTVERIDLESGKVVGDPVSVGRSPGAVSIGEGYVWVANNGDNTVTRLAP